MAEVVWSPRALRDLHAIELRIAKDSPIAAIRFADRLWAAGQSLRLHWERGRLAPSGLRELVSVRPYIIRYSVRPDRVTIIEIRHTARRRNP